MHETVYYMLDDATTRSVKDIRKRLRKQRRFNAGIVLFIIGCMIVAVHHEARISALEDKPNQGSKTELTGDA